MRLSVWMVLVLGACSKQAPPPPVPEAAPVTQAPSDPRAGPGRSGSCSSDADCHPTGCSDTVCASGPPQVTTCEYMPEFACYRKSLTSCGCFSGVCAWQPTEELKKCLAAFTLPDQP